MTEIEVTVRIPLPSIDHKVIPKYVATGSGNEDKIDGYDIEANAIWVEGIDVNNNKIKVNVLNMFDKTDIEDAIFNVLNF